MARSIREVGIRGRTACKRRPHTTQSDPSHPVTANVLDRLFTAHRPNEIWLIDITQIDTAEGLYLVAVMDM
jgi:putative transposase